jgi:hypothetical protein
MSHKLVLFVGMTVYTIDNTMAIVVEIVATNNKKSHVSRFSLSFALLVGNFGIPVGDGGTVGATVKSTIVPRIKQLPMRPLYIFVSR